MPTKLYLPSSGIPPIETLAVDTNWELTNGMVRLPCFTTKKNTALTSSTRAWPSTTTQQWCWWQFQTPPMNEAYSWTTSDTVSMVLGKCAETTTSGDTHLVYAVRVVDLNGEVIRGVIGLYHATSTEYALMASAATRIHNARVTGATTFSSQIGDRIIIELGLHGVTPALENIQMRIGDPSATSDFALTAALTTDLCPWVQLSRTVTFPDPLYPINWPPAGIPSWPPSDVSTSWLSASDLRSLVEALRDHGFTKENATTAENTTYFANARCQHGHTVVGRMLVSSDGLRRYPVAICTDSTHRDFLVPWPPYYGGAGSGVE
jgi:hypothetical protein